MSLLYPQLDRLAAQASLREHVLRSPAQLAASAGAEDPAAVYAATGGVVAPIGHIRALADGIRDIARAAGCPSPSSVAQRSAFDRQLGPYLRSEMDLDPAHAAAGDMWTFFAVRVVPDVVAWRFGFENEERWICSDLTRHALGRLWWQAYALEERRGDQVSYDLLEVLSESELNQVFERRSIGGTPALARAVIRAVAQYRPPAGVARRDLIRDATKRLRRLLPFTSFLCLPEPVLYSRVREVFEASGEALASGSTG